MTSEGPGAGFPPTAVCRERQSAANARPRDKATRQDGTASPGGGNLMAGCRSGQAGGPQTSFKTLISQYLVRIGWLPENFRRSHPVDTRVCDGLVREGGRPR